VRVGDVTTHWRGVGAGRLHQKLFAYSGSFAAQFLDVTVNDSFQFGNKVHLPEKVLTCLQRQGGYGGRGGSWLTHSGMVFEITNHMRMPTYCGVREFVTPESDMMIMPDWMHKSLFLKEGIAVNVRSVAPPKLAFLRVQVRCVWE